MCMIHGIFHIVHWQLDRELAEQKGGGCNNPCLLTAGGIVTCLMTTSTFTRSWLFTLWFARVINERACGIAGGPKFRPYISTMAENFFCGS